MALWDHISEHYQKSAELDFAIYGLVHYYGQSRTGKGAQHCQTLLHEAFWSPDYRTAYARCLALFDDKEDTPDGPRKRAHLWRTLLRPHLTNAALLTTLRATKVLCKDPDVTLKQRDAYIQTLCDAVPYWDAHFASV